MDPHRYIYLGSPTNEFVARVAAKVLKPTDDAKGGEEAKEEEL